MEVGTKVRVRPLYHHRHGEEGVVKAVRAGAIYPFRVEFADGSVQSFLEVELKELA